MPERKPSENTHSAAFTALAGTAAVAGVLALVVAGVLLVHARRHNRTDPAQSPQMRALQNAVRQQPGNAELQEEYRRLDAALREAWFRQRQFASRGGLLLIVFAGVFAAAAVGAMALRRGPPMPQGKADYPAEQAQTSAAGRWAVAGVGVLLAGAAVLWALATPSMLSTELAIDTSQVAPGAPSDGEGGAEARPVGPAPDLGNLDARKQWPRFRGVSGQGVYNGQDAPREWDGREGKNVLWKSPVPLGGHSSPVVWGEYIFVTGADKQKRAVYCYEASAGKLLWTGKMAGIPGSPAEPPDNVMEDTGYAASTAATDGRHVAAIFANGDLACFDYAGRRLWARALGNPKNIYGHATSLTIHNGLLIVLYDQGDTPEEGLSKLHAFDLATGEEKWSVKRPVKNSWATPAVFETARGPQLITAAEPWVISYHAATGEELWRARAVYGDTAPSPVFADGKVFIVTPDTETVAVGVDGAGDVTDSHIAFRIDAHGDIVTPITDGERILLVGTYGLLTCCRVEDGEFVWEQTLDGTFHASPILAGGRAYLMSDMGVMRVFSLAPEFKLLHTNELGERAYATPAFVDGRIYIRGVKNLYCIAEKDGRGR